jgi:large subunit ribosomal protein L28
VCILRAFSGARAHGIVYKKREERKKKKKMQLSAANKLASKSCVGGKSLAVSLKTGARGTGVSASAAGTPRAVPRALEVSCRASTGQQLNGKWCRITGKTANNGFSVSHAHNRTKRLQHVNLQVKRVYWPRGERWVKIRLSAKGMKTIEKLGIEQAAKKAGIDLWKLPFQLDESSARKEWKKQQKADGNVGPYGRTLPKDRRKMMNLEKLAASDHPLAAESKALLDKLKPTLTGNAKEDKQLLNLRKLSMSDHSLAGQAQDVLKRSTSLGPILSEKHRQKKLMETHGFTE